MTNVRKKDRCSAGIQLLTAGGAIASFVLSACVVTHGIFGAAEATSVQTSRMLQHVSRDTLHPALRLSSLLPGKHVALQLCLGSDTCAHASGLRISVAVACAGRRRSMWQ